MTITDHNRTDLAGLARTGPLRDHHIERAVAPTPDCLVVTFAHDRTGVIAYLIVTGAIDVTVGAHRTGDHATAAGLLRERGWVSPISAVDHDGTLRVVAGANAAVIDAHDTWELVDSTGHTISPTQAA